MIRDFTSDELRLFADTIALLERMDGTCNVRKQIFFNVVKLARADFAASYVWNPGARRFNDGLVHNMGKENIRYYEEWHQFRDPMTLKLRARRTATLIEEVTPYPMLHKTEFYNDFLRRDGLDHGINIFLFDRDRDLGDFRLWRAKSGAAFGEREVDPGLPDRRPYLPGRRVDGICRRGPHGSRDVQERHHQGRHRRLLPGPGGHDRRDRCQRHKAGHRLNFRVGRDRGGVPASGFAAAFWEDLFGGVIGGFLLENRCLTKTRHVVILGVRSWQTLRSNGLTRRGIRWRVAPF
jgi:hypothetical protein